MEGWMEGWMMIDDGDEEGDGKSNTVMLLV